MSERYEPTAPWNEEFMQLLSDIALSLRIIARREEE